MSQSDSSPVAPAPAATLMLVRDAPAFQVLMVERHADTPFAPGALVFPGGRLDAQDHDEAWESGALGWSELEDLQRALRVCAIRETFEETAILLARSTADAGRGDWRIGPGPAAAREQVCQGALTFREVIRQFDLTLDLAALTQFARWIAPEGLVRRFDATFFIATAPDDQLAACDGFETVSAEWIEPTRALQLADAGERKLMFPTQMNLRLLAESRCVTEAIDAAHARPLDPVQPRFARPPT